jgi:flavin-dependent dehydrogenase
MCTNFDDFDLVGEDLEVGGVPLGLGPRRSQLDAVLVEAATAAGAELREGFLVREPLWEDGGVVGIRGGGIRSGAAETARAAVVVGADGRNSGLAKAVGAPVQEGVPTLSCWYFSYWSGVAGEALELHVRGRRAIFAFPTNDDLFAVFVAWPIAELPAVRARPRGGPPRRRGPGPRADGAARRGPARGARPGRRAAPEPCAAPPGRAGRSWATPAATRIRTWPSASATPSATRSS